MVERYKEENRCLKRSKVTNDDSPALCYQMAVLEGH